MSEAATAPDLDGLCAQLARMPAFLDAALERAGAGRVATRPAAGGFSLLEHACHLRDLEREGYLLRILRLLAEERPVLEGFDGERVARERDYASQDAREAAGEFAAARAEVLRVVRGLDREALAREGEFAGGRITLAGVVAMAAAHDAGHRAEIDGLVAELG
ncbi:MAG: DinB family protein [Burkholderiales bacterium]